MITMKLVIVIVASLAGFGYRALKISRSEGVRHFPPLVPDDCKPSLTPPHHIPFKKDHFCSGGSQDWRSAQEEENIISFVIV